MTASPATVGRLTTGKCDQCLLVYTWDGKPLLRDAYCIKCKRDLKRTSHLLRGYDHTIARPGEAR